MYHCTLLYGCLIESDQPLFADLKSDDISETIPRYSLKLLELQQDEQFENLEIATNFYNSHGRKLMFYSDRKFARSIKDQPWCFEVKNIVSFYWQSGQSTIYYKLENAGNTELLTFWFTHIYLPAYLTLEDRYDFLHAGAVEIDKKPVLFIAPSTGGKSTMTDYFIKQGHGLISDDKVPTYIEDKQFIAVPSHPHHRPYRRFEDLGYRVDNMFSHTRPIHAIYSLVRNDNDAIIINEINGFKRFETLLPNYLYSFRYLQAERLKYLAKMLSSIPLYEIKRPWDMDKLDKVHAAIVQHSRQLT